jgi:hypothetical protein
MARTSSRTIHDAQRKGSAIKQSVLLAAACVLFFSMATVGQTCLGTLGRFRTTTIGSGDEILGDRGCRPDGLDGTDPRLLERRGEKATSETELLRRPSRRAS